MPTDKNDPPAPLPKSLTVALPAAADIVKHAVALARLEPTLRKQLQAARKSGSTPLARSYVVLKRAMERLDAELETLFVLFDQYKTVEVPAALEQDGVTHVPLAEGFRVGASYNTRASIREGMKDKAYMWLRGNGLSDIITSTVNASTLSSTAKTLMEEKNLELPEEFFNVALMPTTSVTQTSNRR